MKRSMHCLAITFLVSLYSHSSISAPGILDFGTNPSNGHSYFLLDLSVWVEAEATAVSMGGHLATINDSVENDWIYNRWASGRDLWIGFNDAAVEGSFVWSSGEPTTFTKWRLATQEPNDGIPWGTPSNDYAYILAAGLSEIAGEWNDHYAEAVLYGVVEVVPEPSSLALFAAGVLGLGLRNRRKC